MRHSKQKQHSPQSSQAGFTIIESLMAIIVVSVLMVAIGPVVVMSVAARVQARRVERASEAAKTYIDSVNSGRTPAPPVPVKLRGSSVDFLKDAPAPAASSFPSATLDWSKSSELYCVDLDPTPGCSRNSSRDLVIQAFRRPSATPFAADNPAQGYRLGVRVYRADAFKGSGPSKITDEQSALKGTLGGRDVPLATRITDITPQGENNSVPTWCNRLRGSKVPNPTAKNSDC